MIQKHIYKPLPSGLTIRNSSIHGLGLFAETSFKKNTFFGISHIHTSLFSVDKIDINFSFNENEIQAYFEGTHLPLILRTDSNFLNKDIIFPNNLIRTPLGGFINHSDDGNLNFFYVNGGLWGISSNKDILEDEELTLDYRLTPCGIIKKD